MPVNDVKATAAASSNRRGLAARAVPIEVEARLKKSDPAAGYVDCIESLVCVTQSVVNSPYLVNALGLDPADSAGGVAGAVSVTSVTVVPGPTPTPFTCPDPKPEFPGNAAKLQEAVKNCLAVAPSGVGCCAAGADCGVAGTGATALEMPCISQWDTALVTTMKHMFKGAAVFKQPIATAGIRWKTTAVTDMEGMFYQASAFDQNIGAWDTAAVTKMITMFDEAAAFNNGGQPSIKDWNTAAVTSM